MPLIKFLENIKKKNNLKIPHKGIVLEYTDPEQRGRIKCSVETLFEGIAATAESLPWVHPVNNYGLGGDLTSSGFSVPQVGAEVIVTFPFGDIYAPHYSGYWQSETTHQTFTDETTGDEETFGSDTLPTGDSETGSLDGFDEDYPKSYGWIDAAGNWIKVNMKKLFTKMMHSSGTWLKVFDNGDLQLQTAYGNKMLIRNQTGDTGESYLKWMTQNGHFIDIREIDSNGNNWIKLETSGGHSFTLDDANKLIGLTTSDGKLSLTMNEADGSLTLETTGGPMVVKSSADILVESTGGTATVKSSGKCTVDGNQIELKGGGTLAGIVNGLCACQFTGTPHSVISQTVKASF